MTEVQTVMRRATRDGLVAGLLASVLLSAGVSLAGSLQLQFDLSPSTYALDLTAPTGFTLRTDPQPSVGSLVLRIDGVDASGALLGAPASVTLMGLTLAAGALTSVDPVGLARFDQDELTQVSSARGVFDGSRVLFAAGQIAGLHDSSTACAGSVCKAVFIPPRLDTPFSNGLAFALALSALGQPGSGLLRAETAFPFAATGDPVVGPPLVRINGRE